ncbi:hypothetical protein [Streptomyces hirsutus]|uniref:hypothetical protein n=1 Tax=Streptomyces hirsutus TaxID=35620 RepID=UPI00146FE3B9|nr:hypothetical protein [Streptomyces hirsutus]
MAAPTGKMYDSTRKSAEFSVLAAPGAATDTTASAVPVVSSCLLSRHHTLFIKQTPERA